ncbi:MAG: hypothetical protein KGJ87_10355 [Planctomycetota bacterium]|nr:hypothetical protein [Planctomycetota bacterium]MDE1888699.1 hypothetical protein [Planctomycetota bacterium]MDE2217542.1 hypothetical protein [Planctomycetota bacterium]
MDYLNDINKKVYNKKRRHEQPDNDKDKRGVYAKQSTVSIKNKGYETNNGKGNKECYDCVKKDDMMIVEQ